MSTEPRADQPATFVKPDGTLIEVAAGAPRPETGHFVKLGELANADLMALTFLVLMEAAKSAREDLKDVMQSVKDLNDAKRNFRALRDSMSELGETESLRLQMAMDRMSKMMSTLSNVLKKASDTADTIVGNLK